MYHLRHLHSLSTYIFVRKRHTDVPKVQLPSMSRDPQNRFSCTQVLWGSQSTRHGLSAPNTDWHHWDQRSLPLTSKNMAMVVSVFSMLPSSAWRVSNPPPYLPKECSYNWATANSMVEALHCLLKLGHCAKNNWRFMKLRKTQEKLCHCGLVVRACSWEGRVLGFSPSSENCLLY